MLKHTPLLIVALLAFGCFASVRFEARPTRVPASEVGWGSQRNLTASVAPAPGALDVEAEAATLARDLEKTGLFSRVTLGLDEKADVQFSVRSARGIARCGTPFVLTKYTLGLFPGRTAYFHRYDLDIAVKGGESSVLERSYVGEELVGLWALPARLSHRWSRFPRGHSPAAVISSLRADLLIVLDSSDLHSERP